MDGQHKLDKGRRLLQSDDWSERRLGAVILGTVGGPEAVDDLIMVLDEPRGPEDTTVLQAVIAALRQIGDPRAIPAIRKIAEWPNPLSLFEEETRAAAQSVIADLEPRNHSAVT